MVEILTTFFLLKSKFRPIIVWYFKSETDSKGTKSIFNIKW